MNVKMLCDYTTGHAVTVNKYDVHSDAMVDAEANFSSNQGLWKLFNFDALFRGECKADLYTEYLAAKNEVCFQNPIEPKISSSE